MLSEKREENGGRILEAKTMKKTNHSKNFDKIEFPTKQTSEEPPPPPSSPPSFSLEPSMPTSSQVEGAPMVLVNCPLKWHYRGSRFCGAGGGERGEGERERENNRERERERERERDRGEGGRGRGEREEREKEKRMRERRNKGRFC